MVQLLDLPLELFGKVVHELVKAEGPNKSWAKYRIVCWTFANEIHDDIFARQPIQAIIRHKPRPFAVIGHEVEGLGRFLANKVNNPLGATDVFLKEIGTVADFLVKEGTGVAGTVSADLKQEYILKLCTAAAYQLRSPDAVPLLRLLFNEGNIEFCRFDKSTSWSAGPLDKLVGASIVNDRESYQRLLSNMSEGVQCSPLLGCPLMIASRYGYAWIVDGVAGHHATLTSNTWPRVRNIIHAARIAILFDHYETLESLFRLLAICHNTARSRLVLPKREFNVLLSEAIVKKATAAIDIILDLGGNKSASGTTLKTLCNAGDTACIDKLAKRGLLELNKPLFVGYELMKPISIAVESGDWATVQALLSHGADINRSGCLNVALRKGHAHMIPLLLDLVDVNETDNLDPDAMFSPLHTAMDMKDVAAVKAILQRGALVWRSTNPQKDSLKVALSTGIKEIYELVRKAAIESALKIPLFDECVEPQRE
jgi:hypothetical protein